MTDVGVANSYASAGVDLVAASHIKKRIAQIVSPTLSDSVVSGPSGFGAVYDPDPNGDILLVSSTDSVGTKLRIAQAMAKHDTVGIDIVNHCINDILPSGASPIFFLDYIGLGEMDHDLVAEIVSGLSTGCLEAGCALIGGETAALPGIYKSGDYDLVGFVVGTVNKERLLSADNTKADDYLLGIPSNGLHTNGYSLVRSVFGIDDAPSVLDDRVPGDGRTLGEILLTPHRSYLNLLRPVMNKIKTLAHITGGGLIENLPRALATGLSADINLSSWKVPAIFEYIQNAGKIEDDEMFRVFNMGVGMVAVISPDNIDSVCEGIPESWIIGRTVECSAPSEQVRFI